jgi:hypothetical protein
MKILMTGSSGRRVDDRGRPAGAAQHLRRHQVRNGGLVPTMITGRTLPRVSTLLATLLICLSSGSAQGREPKVTRASVPDGGIHPQVQIDARGRVHLIYFKGEPRHGDIFYARSDDGGASFTPPLRVNSHPDSAIIIGTIRGPHLAIGQNDRPHVAWMGSDRAEPKIGKAVPMLYTRLNDAGDAFEPQRNVIQNHPGLDGGGSVAADRNGNVYVAWHAPEHANGGGHGDGHGHGEPEVSHKGGETGHARPSGHGEDEEDRQVWIARSRDDGTTFEPEVAAIPKKTGVCGCCGLNVAAAENGRVFVTFRSATATVNRDIHVLASKDFGKTFEIAVVDPWKVGKCVMSTTAFALRGNDVLAAWETEEQVHLGVIPGKAAPTAPLPMPGPAKGRKHPSVAANARGEYVVAWTEGAGWNKGGDVVWQVFDAQGRPVPGQAGRFEGLSPWSLPSVYAAPDNSFRVVF